MRRVTEWSWPLRLALTTLCLSVVAWLSFAGPSKPANSADVAPQSAAGSRVGQLIYVPIYSSIFYEDGRRTLELAATLSVRNIDPERSISLTRADYYDTGGALIKKYLDKPVTLKPLETRNIVAEKANTAGGPGANFLVAWDGAAAVNPPLVEAVMINTSANLGIAFTTAGRVIQPSGREAAGSK